MLRELAAVRTRPLLIIFDDRGDWKKCQKTGEK